MLSSIKCGHMFLKGYCDLRFYSGRNLVKLLSLVIVARNEFLVGQVNFLPQEPFLDSAIKKTESY